MFFIFSFDLVLWFVLLCVYLLMLVTFPLPTLIITGLGIWWLVWLISRSRQEQVDE